MFVSLDEHYFRDIVLLISKNKKIKSKRKKQKKTAHLQQAYPTIHHYLQKPCTFNVNMWTSGNRVFDNYKKSVRSASSCGLTVFEGTRLSLSPKREETAPLKHVHVLYCQFQIKMQRPSELEVVEQHNPYNNIMFFVVNIQPCLQAQIPSSARSVDRH